MRAKFVSRRSFLATASAASAFTLLPRRLVSGADEKPPSERINLGFIGTGSQGLRVMLKFLEHPDVQAVAVCDPNFSSAGYPQFGKNEFRDGVRRLLKTDSGWDWLSPNDPIQLTPTRHAQSGVCGRDPARKIVEAFYGQQNRSGQFKGCNAYNDFRELLEKEKDLDAVVICSTDHWHALIAAAAMRKGKHVFCQKPMAHSIYEARRMAEIARETRVITQVAVGNQASEASRQIREWIWAGAIGPVRQVLNWSTRPVWPQPVERPKETQTVPEGLDWNLWLGPAPERPFHHAYLPFIWRAWHDFGCGALGDMGCYSFDTIFRALKLGAPSSIEGSSTDRFEETYPKASIVHFHFPAREDMPPVKLSWFDGGLKPEMPEGFERTEWPREGLLFVGDRGLLLADFHGTNPRLLPEAKFKDFKEPPKILPRSPGNEREWLDACKGGKATPGANFEFSSVVTEAVQLGNLAVRMGQKLSWDKEGMKVRNTSSAEKLIRREYRGDWKI